jgi:hypothetical protein
VQDFSEELSLAQADEQLVLKCIKKVYGEEGLVLPAYVQIQEAEDKLLSDQKWRDDEGQREPYDEEHRSAGSREQDERVIMVLDWLKDTLTHPEGMEDDRKYKRFVRYASRFFISKEGKLYRRGKDSNLLVVQKEHQMYMLRAAHDSLSHRGGFATASLLEQRFWWPELEGDVRWYVKACHLCQKRQLAIIKAPPVVSETPSIFQKVHTDVMHTSEKSNG